MIGIRAHAAADAWLPLRRVAERTGLLPPREAATAGVRTSGIGRLPAARVMDMGSLLKKLTRQVDRTSLRPPL